MWWLTRLRLMLSDGNPASGYQNRGGEVSASNSVQLITDSFLNKTV